MTEFVITRLEANGLVFKQLVAGVEGRQFRWKPAPDKWSILEVLAHLHDEERDDFRRRLDMLLHQPGESWPPIDPPAWAVDRRYNEQEPQQVLQHFLAERQRSVDWLRDLKNPDWQAVYDHPQLGKISARQLLLSWLAHDLIHVRQITRLQRQYLEQLAAPLSLDYAGNW